MLDESELHFQDMFAERKVLPNGFITNDLLYVYFVNWTDKDSNFTLQAEEVDTLKWFSFEELEQKFSGEWPENFVPY
jgi:isopentenyldiphosphate isomerase